MSEKWISTKQAAELLGVSQRTIQNWVDEGKLKSSRTAGGHRRLNPAEVSQFLKDNYQHDFEQGQSNHLATKTENQSGDLLRVLVIEDDFNLLRLCELRFKEFSVPHTLFLASNAFQGLIQIGKHRPHLIFTDLKMPQINGLQLINEIISLPDLHNSRIIVLTGLETRDIMTMGKLPDSVLVLPKPIPFNTIETLFYQQANALNLTMQAVTS